MWLVRDKEARIAAAIVVEVDEHSHCDRSTECETGKVDETFQAILALSQKEGKSRLAEFRAGIIHTPLVCFLKVNPNACDAPGSVIKIEDRIQVLGKRVSDYLNTPAEAFHKLADEGLTMVPRVECFYYHSKEAKTHLDYYKALTKGEWDYRGNSC